MTSPFDVAATTDALRQMTAALRRAIATARRLADRLARVDVGALSVRLVATAMVFGVALLLLTDPAARAPADTTAERLARIAPVGVVMVGTAPDLGLAPGEAIAAEPLPAPAVAPALTLAPTPRDS